MASGFKYNLIPPVEQEERYDVQTGIRRRGPYKLNTENLVEGSYLPSFIPVYADLKNKFAYPVRNMSVAEAYAAADTTIKVKKNPLVYVGMFIGNGSKGATVSAIDRLNKDYDVLTIGDAFGENIAEGATLFESKAADGVEQKYVANSALYERAKAESGIVLVALLRAAGEIEPEKLAVPFSDKDKAELKGWFQFNE